MHRIGVVIINFHGEDDTRRAVAAVRASSGVETLIALIDNEGDGEWARREWAGDPAVQVIANAANVGFGAACNQGIEAMLAAGVEGVCLLNNDAEPEPDAMAKLFEAAQAGGLAAPKILRPDGSIYSAGGAVELTRARCRNRGHGELDAGQYDRPESFAFCSACALMLTRSALETGERFYEPYFLYYEDADLCLRLARRGCRVQYEPAALVRHGESRSTPGAHADRLVYYNTRNRWLFLDRNAPSAGVRWAGRIYLAGMTLARGLVWMLTGRTRFARAVFAGLRDGVAGRLGPRQTS